jgi:hypothetical protein
MPDILHFCAWLSRTPFSRAIQDVSWIIPILQSIHILAIGVVMASVGRLDLQFGGIIHRGEPLAGLAERFLPWVWGGLAILLTTGALLIVGEPARELANSTFWLKMGLVGTVVILTLLMARLAGGNRLGGAAPSRRRLVRVLAVASLLIWVAIVVCGRGIAYTGDPDG